METKLKFHNKKFKIMLVGDPHCKPADEQKHDIDIIKDYLALQYAAIEREKPDLVILMGDNATGDNAEDLRKTLFRITKPYADSNTPFAFILGNHDLEWGEIREIDPMYAFYKELPCCVLPDDCTSYGDYDLLVNDSNGKTPILHLLFVYSGSGGPKEIYSYYDYVKKEQNQWIKHACENVKRQYGKIPAVLVQHMPVLEEFGLLDQTSFLTMLGGGVYGQNEQRGNFYKKKSGTVGYLGEAPCPSAYNSGEFEAIKQTESIFAIFFGHDHMNDFIGMHDGIAMGQCKLASFNAYGDGLRQGVRILEFDEDAPFCMNTRMLYYRDLFGDDCSSISGSLKRRHDRTSVKLEVGGKVLGGLAAVSLPLLLIKLLRRK